MGQQCTSCGRLRAAGLGEASPPPPPRSQRQGLFCIRLDSATPVTVEMASWTVVELGGVAHPGAVAVGRLQGTRCEPPPPDPRPPEEYASYALRLPHDPLEHLQCSPADMGRLRVVTANSGGLGSDPRKVPRLIANVACARPDIAHLQEAGTQFPAAWVAGLPYRVCVGPLFPRGGLVTLVQARLLNGSQVREHAQEHSLSVRIEPTRGAVLAAVNVHLPPALPAGRRKAVMRDTSAFLHTAGATVKIVAGDLNKAQGPRGGGWLSNALGPKGLLAGFRAPYRLGDPTNVVWLVGLPSKRDLDWVLVGPETPCEGLHKVLLPGLSTNRMVQCDLVFADRIFAAANPSCRRFRWSQLRPE